MATSTSSSRRPTCSRSSADLEHSQSISRRTTDGSEGTSLQYRCPRQAQAGRRPARRGGEGHPRSQGPQCRHRQEVRLADRHQGRRHGRQGDRARRSDREHGRADGEGGRHQDLRPRRRRHHHRDRAGPGDLPRGPQERHRRRQPDGAEARHRQGGRGRRRASCKDHLGAQRPARRRSPRSAPSPPTTTRRSAT